MYLKKGRWWVSLVPSLLNAAAKATPAVGHGASQTLPFLHEVHNSTAAPPPYREQHLVDTSEAGVAAPAFGTHRSPLPSVSQYEPPTSVSPTLADPYGFPLFSDLDLALTASLPLSGAQAASEDGSNRRGSDRRRGSTKSSNTSSPVDGKSHMLLHINSQDNENVFSVLDNASSPVDGTSFKLLHINSQDSDNGFSIFDDGRVFGDSAGVLDESTGGVVGIPVHSHNIFRFPSPVPNGYELEQPPTSNTLPSALFWTFSAWERVNAKPNEVILLTDVDDTLWSSGGWRVVDRTIGGVDRDYVRGDGYPGITALYFVLASGSHATAAADPPAQPVNYLLPTCPHPGFRSPLLELCPGAPPPHPRAMSSPFSSPTSTGTTSSLVGSPAGEPDVASLESLFIPTPSPGSPALQRSPAAAPRLPASLPPLQSGPTLTPSPTFCAASSFSPATGIRRPNPAQCRVPLMLPPAVGLLTARVSTTFFKGWTRSPSFYYDIDWQLEHGARMIYGPNIFAGAWTHGFENNVELVRDAIGGQHSRGRAKVQGFRSALREGLRPAAQVAATFAAARLQMAAEDSTAGSAAGARQHRFPTGGSATSSTNGSVPNNRQRGGIGRNKFSSTGGYKFASHSMTGLTHTQGFPRTADAEGAVTPGQQSSKRIVPGFGALAALENKQPAGMPVDGKDRGAIWETLGGSNPGRKNEEPLPVEVFGQAIHFSKPTVCNRAVPVIFGDTGEKDLEVAASVAAVFPDRLAAVFSHFVFADRGAEKMKACLRAESVAPRGAVPFTFHFNGLRIRAFQYTFDVVLRMGQGQGSPRSFAEFDDEQAYAVGQRVALYLRDAVTVYSRNYLAEHSKLSAMLQATGTAAARGGQKRTELPVQAHPLLFVKFSRLTVPTPSQGNAYSTPRFGISGLLSRVQTHLKRKVSELTGYIAEEDSSQGVDVVPIHPVKKREDPTQWDHGVPIIPYRTTISAATGALLVQMISVQDLVNVIIASVRDLRSLGPPASCSNVDALEDHLFDLLAAVNLVGDRIRSDKVQHHEAYSDAVAALRKFYEISRFCKTLAFADLRAEPSSPKEEVPGYWSPEAEALGNVGANIQWEELQHSPAFEACFTAFKVTTDTSAAEASGESGVEAHYPGIRAEGAVEAASVYLERYAPAVRPLARLACACLPQLIHWRSAGGGELEFLSAEWLVTLTHAVMLSKKMSMNQSVRRGAPTSSRRGSRGHVVEGSTKNIRWNTGEERTRRLSETTDTDSPVVAAASSARTARSKLGRQRRYLQSSGTSSVGVAGGKPPAGTGAAVTAVEFGATTANIETQDRKGGSPQSPAKKVTTMGGKRLEELTDASTLTKRSSSGHGGATFDVAGSTLYGDVASRTSISDSIFDGTALPNLATDNSSLTNASLEDLLSSILGETGVSTLPGDYLSSLDDPQAPVMSRQRTNRPRSSEGDSTSGLEAPSSPSSVTSLTKDCGSAYDARGPCHTPPRNEASTAYYNRSDSSAVDTSISCPALNLHHLIRLVRPICAAQRRRLGQNAPCAVLSRVLYDDKLLSTFNAIHVWIKAGSPHPLYLENIGVTLDPSRPKGGRLNLSKIASTVVEKSDARERYNIQQARAAHKGHISMLPFFMDPTCNPFA